MASLRRSSGQKSRHNLDTRITVKRNAATAADDAANPMGEHRPHWVTHCERWAAHYGSASKLVFLANRNVEICTDIYVVRYDDLTKLITAEMQIQIGSRTLRIVGTHDEGDRKLWIHLRCVEEK